MRYVNNMIIKKLCLTGIFFLEKVKFKSRKKNLHELKKLNV